MKHKPFEATQRSVKIKIFISIQLLEMHGTLRVKILIKIWKNNDFFVIFGLLNTAVAFPFAKSFQSNNDF